MIIESDYASLDLCAPAVYQIQVKGQLGPEWLVSLEGMVITPGGPAGMTTLTGRLADQAALHGLLRRLYNLGLPLISLTILDGSHL